MTTPKRISTNFSLPEDEVSDICKHSSLNALSKSGLAEIKKIIKDRKCINGLLHANPSIIEVVVLTTLKTLGLIKSPIFVFDLILKNPGGRKGRLLASLKGFFYRKIDYIFAIHKDTSGYQEHYHLRENQFIYVPFKANNFDFKEKYLIDDEGYIVALGASQRDYLTLIEASKGIQYPVKIVCSDENAVKHNANFGVESEYPPGLSRVKETVSVDQWYELIAKSSFVVVPILSSALQPAGISVYLEAMALKKAVIISRGASTNEILESGKTAIIVEPNDPQQLRAAMRELIENRKLRNALEFNGYNYAVSLENDARLRRQIRDEICKRANETSQH